MSIILTIKEISVIIQLRLANKVVDEEYLTIDHGFDTLLITAIDKLITRNKIDKLSLKSLEIRGKIDDKTVSGMIIKTVKSAMDI